MKISAWHSTDLYPSAFKLGVTPNVLDAITLGTTHILIPVTYTTETDDHSTALEEAFSFFNWVHVDFYAPQEVNDVCRDHNSHASMSVGDVVELDDGTFWYCAPIGWKQITTPLNKA